MGLGHGLIRYEVAALNLGEPSRMAARVPSSSGINEASALVTDSNNAASAS